MKSANKMIVLVAVVCAAPFVSAWIAYYLFPPSGGESFGKLLEIKPVPKFNFDAKQAEIAQGKFLLVQLDGECEKTCEGALYSTRQARTMLNKETDRLVRVLLTERPVRDEVLRAHPDLLVVKAGAPNDELRNVLLQNNVLIDPIGNQVIAWNRSLDVNGIKRLNGDLSRLMRASKWGAQAAN